MTLQSLATELLTEAPAVPRATIGCVQLPTDLTLDTEGPALASRLDGVRMRMQKVVLDTDVLTVDNYGTARGRIETAARTLRPENSVDAIGLACTSLAFTLGIDDVQEELRRAHPKAKVTDMATALGAALESIGARRVALVTPYNDELHGRCLGFLEGRGIEVEWARGLGLSTDAEISAIGPGTLIELVRSAAEGDPKADAVVLCCSAFAACAPGQIDELERAAGRPVLTSQQAFLWHLLRLAGVEDPVGGYGSLLRGEVDAKDDAVEPATASDRFDDVYPSRVKEPKLVPRVDPVVARERADAGPLPRQEVERYRDQGFSIMRQVFAPHEVAHLKAEVEGLRSHYESMDYEALDRATDMRVITERGGSLTGDAGGPVLKSIWQIHLPPEHAPHMRDAAGLSRRTICDARLVDVARQLLGEDVYVHQSRINFQRGVTESGTGGSGFLWHQDFEQWHCEDGMPRMRAVSMAVLLEKAVPANGALMVMPGSHTDMLQARAPEAKDSAYGEGSLSRGPQLSVAHLRSAADRYGIVHCAGEPGDVVMFDCNLIHGSHTNISPWGRCMFFSVYNAVSNTPAPGPYFASERRPEHIGSHDPRFAGVALPSLVQDLTEVPADFGGEAR